MAGTVSSKGLRELAERYSEAAKKLLDAADILDGGPMGNGDGRGSQHESGGKKTRLDELRAFLKKNGPSSRKEILAKTGVPSGTIGMLLKPPMFKKDSEGKWDIVEGAD